MSSPDPEAIYVRPQMLASNGRHLFFESVFSLCELFIPSTIPKPAAPLPS
jgi:hypothetical protein